MISISLSALQSDRPLPKVPKDLLLAELLKRHDKMIWKYHDHDSLLENQVDENLTEEERKAAWEEFENEKKGLVMGAAGNPAIQNAIMTNINPAYIQVGRHEISSLNFKMAIFPIPFLTMFPLKKYFVEVKIVVSSLRRKYLRHKDHNQLLDFWGNFCNDKNVFLSTQPMYM